MQNRKGDLLDYLTGQTGKDIVTGAGTGTGRYFCLHATAATVIASGTDALLKNGSMTGLALAAGDNYYGDISTFTLTSGSIIAYYL